MDKTTFWKIISSSKFESLGDLDQQIKKLHTKLATLSPEHIEGFDQAFAEYYRESDTLGDHPKAAIHDHLKTGHTEVVVQGR